MRELRNNHCPRCLKQKALGVSSEPDPCVDDVSEATVHSPLHEIFDELPFAQVD